MFAAVALVRVAADDSSLEATTPSLTWLNPFGEGGAALTAGLLLGVFAYWGWESAVNLTEETDRLGVGTRTCWRLVHVILLVTYVSVAIAIVAYSGTQFLEDNREEEEAIFAILATEVLGSWDWVLLISVATLRSPQPRRPSSRHHALRSRWHGVARCLPFRQDPPAVPHSARVDLGGRRHRRGRGTSWSA